MTVAATSPEGDDPKDEKIPQIFSAKSTWGFGGEKVIEATKALPDHQRDAIRWLFHYCIENGLTMQQASESIRFDKTSVYRVMTGKYAAKPDGIVEAILSFKKLVEQRDFISRPNFVDTETSKKIHKICESALIYNSISFIFGESQIGKTTALLEYARRNNHGRTKYIRMPSSAGIQLMMKEFAVACAVSPRSCFEQLRERVLRAIDRNHLVIVDEVHQTFVSYHKKARLSSLELVREIHDRTGCGMVLCGTNVLKEELQQGEHKKLLDQLRLRGIFTLQLPAVPTRKDLDAIAVSYGLAPADGEAEQLMLHIAKSYGLGKFCKFLAAASRHATKKGEKMKWKHFVTAHDIVKKLSEGNGE